MTEEDDDLTTAEVVERMIKDRAEHPDNYERCFWIAAAFATGLVFWSALYLAACFALMFAGRWIGGMF